MGQTQVQEALAMLIRLPDHNRSNLDDFLSQYDLSDLDKKNLRYVAHNREVNKFGYKMRKGRIHYLMESVPLSLEYVDEMSLINFVKDQYDPFYTLVHAKKIYRSFRKFFEAYREGDHKKILSKYVGPVPEFFFDLASFELLDSELEFQGFKNSNPQTKDGPLLHHRFETLTLDYKIQEYVEEKRTLTPDQDASIEPRRDKTSLLFLGDEDSDYGYQLFEIDEVGVNFLEQARNNLNAPKPEYYQDFIDCGLCQ